MLYCMKSCLHFHRVTSYYLHKIMWLLDNRAGRMDNTGDTINNEIVIVITYSHMVLRICLYSRRQVIYYIIPK